VLGVLFLLAFGFVGGLIVFLAVVALTQQRGRGRQPDLVAQFEAVALPITSDNRGNRNKTFRPFTLGVVEVPECADHMPELYCQRKGGLRSLEKFEDLFRRSKERVTLESEALAGRYETFCRKGQDAVWLRRMFSPAFIVWLTESAPDKFAFELVDGTLVAYVRGHQEDTAGLEAVAAATGQVVTRRREKSGEGSGEGSEA
jgi:hypothetical protein